MILLVTAAALLTFAVMALSSTVTGDGLKSEKELRRDIFRGYDKLVRPVRKASKPVVVQIFIDTQSLRSMNEKDQLISLDTWIEMRWIDEYLVWDPSEYDNIEQLLIEPSEIWKPDIGLLTASSDSSRFPTVHTRAILFNFGWVFWHNPFTVNSWCPIPFQNNVSGARDSIECNIRFGSWIADERWLDLQLMPLDKDGLTSNFQDINPDWKLVKVLQNKESKRYNCCIEAYPFVNFNVTLKRRNSYLNPK